ncbi:isoprenylcysteine carboxylmethyltransferase family protein [Myxococcota bacterium]|nr:isoprenylcysteine carboxylmethyltransferase family protein [Myxococcota bacterium]
MRHPLRRKNLSPRLLPFYALALLGFWWAQPSARSLGLGAAVMGVGLALRAWAAGHLVKRRVLCTSGPYAHLRHPLYLGTLILVSGFGVAAGSQGGVLVFGAFVAVFFLYYLPYKERVESERLEQRYSAAYEQYRLAVPGLWPRWSPWRTPSHWSLDPLGQGRWLRARYHDNNEWGTLLGVMAGFGALVFRALFQDPGA